MFKVLIKEEPAVERAHHVRSVHTLPPPLMVRVRMAVQWVARDHTVYTRQMPSVPESKCHAPFWQRQKLWGASLCGGQTARLFTGVRERA